MPIVPAVAISAPEMTYKGMRQVDEPGGNSATIHEIARRDEQWDR